MKQNELLQNTSRSLETELWRLKVHVRRGILCTAHAQRAFLFFDRLYLVTDMSSRDGKGVIYLSFACSFMWCEQFCPGRTFLLYMAASGKNSETPLEPPEYFQYSLTLYLNVFYIIAGINTPNFTLV